MTRRDVIERAREEGRLVAAVFPIRYPRELLRAFGIEPIEVWGPPRVRGSEGASHLQPYICSVIHNGLSFLLEGGLDDVDLILVPHCCDSLQGLGSLLKDFVNPRQEVLTFYIPRGDYKASKDFLVKELVILYERLRSITGKEPSAQEIMSSIIEEEMADRLSLELYRNRKRIGLSSREFVEILRKREYLPPKLFAEEVEKRLDVASGDVKGVEVIISGILPEPMDLLDEIDDAGGVVVSDDMSCLRRRLLKPGKSEDPFERIAERLLSAPYDPVLGCFFAERISFLERLIEETGAKGVVFYNVKFCEGEDFYYPEVSRWLKSRGIDFVKIEADITPPLPKQVSQRLRAFIEILGERCG